MRGRLGAFGSLLFFTFSVLALFGFGSDNVADFFLPKNYKPNQKMHQHCTKSNPKQMGKQDYLSVLFTWVGFSTTWASEYNKQIKAYPNKYNAKVVVVQRNQTHPGSSWFWHQGYSCESWWAPLARLSGSPRCKISFVWWWNWFNQSDLNPR